MKKQQYSQTYVHLLDLLFKLKTRKVDNTAQHQNGNKLNIIKLGTKSDRVIQEITIANDDLFNLCTSNEWYALGKIGIELHYGNALWIASKEFKSKSTNRKTLSSLAKKNLVIPTETTDIYIVNPFYLRKGDLLRVLHGTAEELVECTKVSIEHVRTIQQPRGVDFTFDKALLDM